MPLAFVHAQYFLGNLLGAGHIRQKIAAGKHQKMGLYILRIRTAAGEVATRALAVVR